MQKAWRRRIPQKIERECSKISIFVFLALPPLGLVCSYG